MGASTTIIYTVSLDDDGNYAFTTENGETAVSQLALVLDEDKNYRFDCLTVATVPLLSISVDGSHTDTDGEGTMGVQSTDGVTYYVDDVALADIEAGDDATTQFKDALAGGAATALYFDIAPASMEAVSMYYYDADSAAIGGTASLAFSGTGTTPAIESYRDKTEHHPAPPSYRLAGKKAVRSAALQGVAQGGIDSHTTKGTQRGSNNSGHPPIASGEQIGGGSKGSSN